MLVAKEFKAWGSRFLTLLTDGPSTKKILIAAEKKFVAESGYGFILSPASLCFSDEENPLENILTNGIIGIVEGACATAYSQVQRLGCNVFSLIFEIDLKISEKLPNSDVSTKNDVTEAAKALFDSNTKCRRPNYAIVNFVNGERVVIGSVSDSASFSGNLSGYVIYPGNTTERPKNTPALVQMSANSLPD
jgi:hypothetical protein